MTDKPTGDTIDPRVERFDTLSWMTWAEIATNAERDEHAALAEELTRLAERPDRAVARGDSVTVRRYDLAALALVGAPTLQVTDEAAYNRLSAALTTPTETTDPAMESNDEQG